MRGDFSRSTFQRLKRYQAVLMQQGRVQVDADWNEQQQIHGHLAETEATDVIGDMGGPKGDAGFGIQVAAADLIIGAGRYYVDGILCENEAPVSYRAQEDLPAYDPPLANGATYLAYLEVWRRHVTPIEDPSIRETALGGADTATRLKTVQQVRLLQVTPPVGPVTRKSVFPEWTALLERRGPAAVGQGTMAAKADVEAAPASPCTIPPTAGYRRLENQLYRVEVHRGGSRAEARIKWSRDNGSVVTAIEHISGAELTLHDLGRDDLLGFRAGQWVEVSDERAELMEQHGKLVLVQEVLPAKRAVAVSGSLPAVDLGRKPTLRRWDHPGSEGDDDGLPITGEWMALEGGVSVRFGDGRYNEGDYWLVPARTAISSETGTIDWPTVAGEPMAQPPHGVAHHFAPLAVVSRQGGQFVLLGDCRTFFPSLTTLDATDVAFESEAVPSATNVREAIELLSLRGAEGCTLGVSPGDDLVAAFASIEANQDAMICFAAGTYELNAALQIAGKGHLVLQGCGRGTRLVAANDETALLFERCKSVRISGCAVETGRVRSGGGGDLNGSLTFRSVPIVEVEGVSARCAGAGGRHASCITVRNDTPVGSVRVRGCDLAVGDQQIGILVVNGERVLIEDNEFAVVSGAIPGAVLRGAAYASSLSRLVLSHATPAGTKASDKANAKVVFNGHEVRFATAPGLVNEWQKYVDAVRPPGINNPRVLLKFLTDAATAFFRGEVAESIPLPMRKALAMISQGVKAVAQQGIVVAGSGAREVRILNNSIRGVVQGIHVGVSHKEGARGTPDQVGMLSITGNSVAVSLASVATRERHAIFAGNCKSVVIEDNRLVVERVASTTKLRIEAIRLFGLFDQYLVVRHNHMTGFDVGIRFSPTKLFGTQLWVVTENFASQNPVVDVSSVVKPRIFGILNNFA